jgi:hypothetical protein
LMIVFSPEWKLSDLLPEGRENWMANRSDGLVSDRVRS